MKDLDLNLKAITLVSGIQISNRRASLLWQFIENKQAFPLGSLKDLALMLTKHLQGAQFPNRSNVLATTCLITFTVWSFFVGWFVSPLGVLTAGSLVVGQSWAAVPAGKDFSIEIDAAKPRDYWLAAGTTGLLASEVSSGLSRIPPGNVGWFDYDFKVDRQGWYRVVVSGAPQTSRIEFIFDLASGGSNLRLAVGKVTADGRSEAGFIWLPTGPHQLRLQNFFWTGFPQIALLRLEAMPDQFPAFRVVPPEKSNFRVGACTPLLIETGGNETSFTINATFNSKGRVLRRQIGVPPSQVLVRHSLDLACDSAGDVAVDLHSNGAGTDLDGTAHLNYAVFDASGVEPTFRRGPLAIDIDAASRQPDFQAGETSATSGAAGIYRESGPRGTTAFIRRTAAIGFGPTPNWFAYSVDGLSPNRPYVLEIEFPDDAPRVFVVALRSTNGQGYPTSIGAETGVIWPLSNRMVKMSAIVWPSSSKARVVVFNIHDGMKAAMGHIRLYEAESPEASSTTPSTTGRDVTFWYEEGDNFRDLVGEGYEPDAVFTPIDRYLRLARWGGATIVSPTVVIYNFAMYPSRFHLAFAQQDRDLTAAFMLAAERYRLKVVPQLHPRADELLWAPRDQASLEKRLLLSAQGQRHLLRQDGTMFRPPFYNPLNDDVRRWYVDMVGELADRYKDYPAFAGIDLRVSDWQNPALNNLVSLEWGYEADTVARFFRETGLTPPTNLDISNDVPRSARQRYSYLLSKQRAAWISWRCEKIRDLFRDIVLRVRSARPDLRVSVSLFADRSRTPDTMREFGIDIELLKSIDGLTLIDARFRYGAREADPAWRRQQITDLDSPEHFGLLAGLGSRPHVILPMEYIEITDKAAPAQAIGLSESSRKSWISSASEPPGRYPLARYATIVGLIDPFMLGGGGNGYVFGDEAQRQFLAEFRSLPRVAFERVPRAPDTIVVRQRDRMFYVVNMLDLPISARLHLDAPGPVKRTTSGQIFSANDGVLQVDLKPYQMMVFEPQAARRILDVEASLSNENKLNFSARMAAAQRSADRECGGLLVFRRCGKARKRMQEIETALAQGDYWTAKRLLDAGN